MKQSTLIIQDLSSCLPLEFLKNALKLDVKFKKMRNKGEVTTVGVDATASPGNKTLQLAEISNKVYAFERDAKRAKVLENRVAKAGANENVECFNLDFIESPIPGFSEQSKEEIAFIICDPSCSGSGMRLHTDQETSSVCTLDLKTPET